MIVFISAEAQDKKAETLKEIRGLYSQTMQDIKQRDTECPECMGKLTIVNEENLPGTGMQTTTTTFYYNSDYNEEAGMEEKTLRFVRKSYNYAARQYLQEYLFEDGQLIFAFQKGDDDPYTEIRMYDKNGIVIYDEKQKENGVESHPVNMQKISGDDDRVEAIKRGAYYVTGKFDAMSGPAD